MLREVKLLREQANRFRDAASGWKTGDMMPKRPWFLQKTAETEPEQFDIQVMNDAFTPYKAMRSNCRRALGKRCEKEIRGLGTSGNRD